MAQLLRDFLHGFFGDDAGRLAPASNPHPIHAARHRSRKMAMCAAAIFGIFCKRWNPLKR
jgi:hypothetical protein